jgi:hypothetical protein
VIILKRRRVHAQTASAREYLFFVQFFSRKELQEELKKKLSFCCKNVAEQHGNNER